MICKATVCHLFKIRVGNLRQLYANGQWSNVLVTKGSLHIYDEITHMRSWVGIPASNPQYSKWLISSNVTAVSVNASSSIDILWRWICVCVFIGVWTECWLNVWLMGFDLLPRKLKVVNIHRTSIWGIYFIIALSEKHMPFFVKVNSIDVISSF